MLHPHIYLFLTQFLFFLPWAFCNCYLCLFPLFFSPSCSPLSSECSGSVVPGERATAGSPGRCPPGPAPGPWTQRRPQHQSGKCPSASAQTRALRGGCRGRESPPPSACCPFSYNSCPRPGPGTPSSPRQSTEPCDPSVVAGGRGSGSNQTTLGHQPATEFGLPGNKHPAVQPHRQLCQLAAQPQGAQPVSVMEVVVTLDPQDRSFYLPLSRNTDSGSLLCGISLDWILA